MWLVQLPFILFGLQVEILVKGGSSWVSISIQLSKYWAFYQNITRIWYSTYKFSNELFSQEIVFFEFDSKPFGKCIKALFFMFPPQNFCVGYYIWSYMINILRHTTETPNICGKIFNTVVGLRKDVE